MRRMWSKNQLENQSKQAAQEVIESGLVENAKPLYYHGIEIFNKDGSTVFDITFAIIDNDSTPYTWERIKAWVNSIDDDVLINANGFYNNDSEAMVNLIGLFHAKNQSNMVIAGNTASCTYLTLSKSFTTWDTILGADNANCNDQCNKLN